MASSKQAMQTKPLRNDQEIIEFIVRNWWRALRFKWLGLRRYYKCHRCIIRWGIFVRYEWPQQDPDILPASLTKKRFRPRPNNAKKTKKGSDKYKELCCTSTEPPQPMRRHLFDRQPCVNVFVFARNFWTYRHRWNCRSHCNLFKFTC